MTGSFSRQVPMLEVAEAVAAHYGVSLREIVGRGKAAPRINRARQVCHALALQLSRRSMAQVGLAFDRDATTVHHSLRTIEYRARTDAQLCADLASIRAALDAEEVADA